MRGVRIKLEKEGALITREYFDITFEKGEWKEVTVDVPSFSSEIPERFRSLVDKYYEEHLKPKEVRELGSYIYFLLFPLPALWKRFKFRDCLLYTSPSPRD